MKAGILYPDTEYNYAVPELMSDNLLKNIVLLGESKSKQDVKDVQERFTRQTWENPVFMVNAFYMSAGNQLVIPAGIVQWPFYSMDAGMEGWNFGGLGCVIGHEITHAYDTDGKEFDHEGNRRVWWSAQDNRVYNRKTRAIIALYNKAMVEGRRVKDDKRLEELRDFFISYAVSWREKMRREKQLQQLLTDVHAPAIVRVNMVVAHFQEWYDTFEIGPDDKLYIPPEQRIRLF